MNLPPNTPAATYSQSAVEAQSCRWPPPWSLRSGLMSFQRPNYFCGHLLTDADLTLEQRYFREKTRLYHRALDGHGIVCGLRLTCDHNCPGGILVGRGYAIDDCGNDLVLPERARFDLVSRLIEKGLITQEPSPDPCSSETVKSECHFQQCFYITICYQEDETDFATPLVTACQPMLSECEATRISEAVRLDVVDTLPSEESAESALKRRLESCFKIFSEGAFFDALQKHQAALSQIITPPADSGKALERADYQGVFRELRGHLLLYLNKYPDKYNCTIEDEIRKIGFPDNYKNTEELRDAFSALLALAWQHAVSSALGEFVPSCHEPSETSRILLGSVVVENGRIVRVCNYPRSYVWSAANFPEVLLATALGGLASQKEGEDNSETGGEAGDAKTTCCRDFDFDLECFLQWFKVNPKAPFYAGTELLSWLETLGKSIREGFDFTNPCNFSSRIFEGMHQDKATESLNAANIKSRVTEAPLETGAPSFFTLIQAAGLATGEKPIVLAVRDPHVTSAFVEHPEILAHINHLQNQINTLKALVERPPGQRPGPGPATGGPPPSR
jgi:hypothetical protein